MFDLSILILTHNRPRLCKRAIQSTDILKNKIKCEIIVNDDSDTFFDHDSINRIKSDDISYIYYSLFKLAKGKYIYFLEDDDILTKSFLGVIKRIIDDDLNLAYCNYIDVYNISRGIEFKKNNTIEFKKFINDYNPDELFQLSRCIFKKEIIKKFPKGNNIYNDYILFKNVHTKYINIFKDIIYKQTTDGKDNISFKKYNKDKRFFKSYEEFFYEF